jgi:hypothetical protein
VTDDFSVGRTVSTSRVVYGPGVAEARKQAIAEAERKAKIPKQPDWSDLPDERVPQIGPTFVRNVTNISRRDGYLVVGQSSVDQVNEYAAFMSPNDADAMRSWAKYHPTMDPRAWQAMAMAHILPMDPDGRAVALADEARQATEGTRELIQGAPNQKPSTPPKEKHDNGFSLNPVQWAANAVDLGWDIAKTGIRVPFTALESLKQAVEAPIAVTVSQNRHRREEIMRLGLTPKDVKELGWEDSLPDSLQPDYPIGRLGKPATGDWANAYTKMLQDKYGSTSPNVSNPALQRQARETLIKHGQGGGILAQTKRAIETTSLAQALRHPNELLDRNEGIFVSAKIEARQAAADEKYTDLRTMKDADEYDAAVKARQISVDQQNGYAVNSAYNNAIFDYLLEHPSAPQPELHKVGLAAARSVPLINLSGEVAGAPPRMRSTQIVDPSTGAVRPGAPERVDLQPGFDPATHDRLLRAVPPQAWTPGRAIAQVYWDPNTVAYNAVSGAADFLSYLVADPAMLIPANAPIKAIRSLEKATEVAFLSKAGQAVRLDRLVSKIPGDLARSLESGQELRGLKTTLGSAERAATATAPARPAEMGGFYGAHVETRGAAIANEFTRAGRPDLIDPLLAGRAVISPDGRMISQHGRIVVGERAWNWLNRDGGAEFVRNVTGIKDAAQIMLLTNGGFGWNVSKLLADAGTEAETRAILGSRMGREINKASQFGPQSALLKNMALKDGWVANITRMAPRGGAFDGEDPDVIFHEVLAFGRGIGLGTETTLKHINAINAAPFGAARYNAMYSDSGLMGEVVKYMVSKGVDVAHAREATRAFAGGMDVSARNNFLNKIANGGIVLANPEWLPKALLEHEQLGRVMALPNYRDIRRTTNILNNIARSVNADQATELVGRVANGTTSIWRNLTLMRPAYALRELIDLTVSAALGGYSSILAFPVNAILMAQHAAMGYQARRLPGRATQAILTGVDPQNFVVGIEKRRAQIKKALETGEITRVSATRQRAGVHLREVTYRASIGSSVEATEIANYLNKNIRTLVDYLGWSEGASRIAPSFNQTWGRINGEGFYDALQRYIETGDVREMGHLYDGLNAAHGNFVQDERASRARSGTMTPMSRDLPEHHRDYINGFIDALWDLTRDRDMRNLADPSMTQDDVLREFRTGTRPVKKEMFPTELSDARPQKDLDFLNTNLSEMRRVTIDDPLLTEAVRTGKFAGEAVDVKNKALREHIEHLINTRKDEMLPTVSVYRMDPSRRKDFADMFNRVVDGFFGSTGEITDMLVRAPVARQIYVRELERIGPSLSKAAKAKAVANLRAAGDAKLAKRVQSIDARGTLSVDSMEAILDGAVPAEMKKIFYDASQRGNYQVALRTAMPFAQATFNTFKRWGLMSMQNPQMMYRVVRPIEALMDPGSAFLYEMLGVATGDESMKSMYTPGHPELSVNGFFYTNDSYASPGHPGERMFTVPVIGPLQSGFLASRAGELLHLGAPGAPELHLRPEARAQSLNIAGPSINPGMGPVFTMLASTPYLQNAWSRKDTVGQIARFLAPYGTPEGSAVDKLLGTFLPTWAQKLARADDGEFNVSQAVKLQPFLEASGDYDTSKESERNRLERDAQRLSHSLYGMGAIFGMMTPTQFSNLATMAIRDPNSADPAAAIRYYTQYELVKVFRNYTAGAEGDLYDQRRAQFVADWGPAALNSVLPLTTPTEAGVPTATNDVWEFRTNQREAYDSYLPVIGLFFSGDDLNSSYARGFSPELSRAQRQAGERRYLTAFEAQVRSQQQLGWMLYNQKTREIDALPITDQQKLVLRARTRKDISEHYKYFTGKPSNLGETAVLMNILKEAVHNKDVQTLPSAPYLAQYLKARDEAIGWLFDHGMSDDLSSKQAQPAATILIRLAQRLNNEDTSGGFRNFWNRVGLGDFERS